MPSTSVDYQQRKEQVRCTRSGCGASASDESSLCPQHHVEAKAAAKAYARRLRARRARARVCVHCGKPRPKRAKSCLACRVRRNRLKIVRPGGVVAGVDKLDRIESQTRTHDDGRTRYHGQGKRGNQPHLQLDGQDLGFARRELEAGEIGIKLYEQEVAKHKAGDPEALPRVQRDDVKSAALHQLGRAIGHIEDVLERRGHFKQRHGRREGDT